LFIQDHLPLHDQLFFEQSTIVFDYLLFFRDQTVRIKGDRAMKKGTEIRANKRLG